MKIKKVMLFAYDFPHKKTQDFIFRLIVEGFEIAYIIAAPRVKLNIPISANHIAPNNVGLIHPKKISNAFSIPYIVLDHNSNKAVEYIKNHPVDMGIVAGARILNEEIINASRGKILNIHPGLLPQVRGLDTLLWSIYANEPIGLSAHFISTKIDLGMLIYKEKIKIDLKDTIIDISLRMLEKQPDVLIKAISMLEKKKINSLKNINLSKETYRTKMSSKDEDLVLVKFNEWKSRHASL